MDAMSTGSTDRHRVVVVGGGVAGLEAMLSLRDMAGDLLDVWVVSPEPEFRLRALSVNEPFSRSAPRSYSIEQLCREHGAQFVQGTAVGVDPALRVLRLDDGRELDHDSLLVAVGARPEPSVSGKATVFRGPQDVELVHGLVQDVEAGYVRSVAFVVPGGTTWPLPLYELALMLAERASAMGQDAARISIVTAEGGPLDVFGAEASTAVADHLTDAGITVLPGREADRVEGRRILDADGMELAHAERVVVLPNLRGLALEGLPHDAEGFVPTDPNGRVRDTVAVWAAGDGTTSPIKQGGVAAEQAAAAAADIANAAGAEVPLRPFTPVLRAELLTGSHRLFLRHEVGTGESGATAGHPLWWPHAKVAAPHLAAWLSEAERPYDPRFDSGPRVLHAEGDPSGGIELLR